MNVAYPYTCPYWQRDRYSSDPVKCVHYGRLEYQFSQLVEVNKCELGRKICFIAFKLDEIDPAQTVEDLIESLKETNDDIANEELETIYVNLSDYFTKYIIRKEERS